MARLFLRYCQSPEGQNLLGVTGRGVVAIIEKEKFEGDISRGENIAG
jgi:hypothetical protein